MLIFLICFFGKSGEHSTVYIYKSNVWYKYYFPSLGQSQDRGSSEVSNFDEDRWWWSGQHTQTNPTHQREVEATGTQQSMERVGCLLSLITIGK